MSRGGPDRLLTFEVAGAIYALPIHHIAEVAERSPVSCIPTVPEEVGGVINHHGDALPVVRREVLFEVEGSTDLQPSQHLLVLHHGSQEPVRVGVPVDRVIGLVDGTASRGQSPVADRRPIDGRVVHVLDTQRLLERASEVIRRSILGQEPLQGETP